MAKVTERKCYICGPKGWMYCFLNLLEDSTPEWADKKMMEVIKNGVNAPNPKNQQGIDEQLDEIRNGKGICVECYEKYVIPAKFGRENPYGRGG